MAKGIIGQNFTFQTLFLDSDGVPLVVDDPTIEIYRWDDDGDKVVLLMVTALPPSVPAETGRYAYTFLLPGDLSERDVVYGLLKGQHPVSGDTLAVEREVSVFAQGSEPLAGTGLTARFVRGG